MGPSRLGNIIYYMSMYHLLERWFDFLNRLTKSGKAGIFILLVLICIFSLFFIALLMNLYNFSGIILFTTYSNQKFDMYQYCKRMFYQAVYFSCIQVSNNLFLHYFLANTRTSLTLRYSIIETVTALTLLALNY